MHCWQPPRSLGLGVAISILSAQRNTTQRVHQPASVATCKTGNRRTQQVTEAAVMKDKNYIAEGTCRRQHRGQQGGRSSRNTQHLLDHSPLLFAARSAASATKQHQDANQISRQSGRRVPYWDSDYDPLKHLARSQ